MAIFKNRRKAKDQGDDDHTTTNALDLSTSAGKPSKSFRRNKKNDVGPPVKPVIDLGAALPDTDDFRTSLLMPGLSARFSMLREQYDPNTKVGKASDDSVLFPKRASRMNLFNHNPLTDIAEVESIYSSFRPPFAEEDRSRSMSDGYNSDDGGSMMSRSKPGEGNNLFSGRQKLYRIPASSNSSRNLIDAESRRPGGKQMYENDIPLSMFQQMRAKDREEREKAERLADDRAASPPTDEHEEQYAINSPSTPFSKNRGTTSSTTSGPSNRRTSTAATSITSESPVTRQSNNGSSQFGVKSRTSDYANNSAEDISMKRNPSSESRRGNAWNANADQPPLPKQSYGLAQSRSAVSLGDKYARAGPGSAINPYPVSSTPPPAQNPVLASLDFGLKDSAQKSTSQTRRYQTASPTAQLMLEDDAEIYGKNVQPNDRGKATAMGLFNKPQQQFDEQQFLQRQLQMFEGRASPSSFDAYSESRTSPEPITTIQPRTDSIPAVPQSPSMRNLVSGPLTDDAPSPVRAPVHKVHSTSSLSHSINRARSRSSASDALEAAAAVKARVEALIKSQNAELAVTNRHDAGRDSVSTQQRQSHSSKSTYGAVNGTFFNSFDGSESETDQDGSLSRRLESTPRLAPEDVHPALRNGTNDFHFGEEVAKASPRSQRQSAVSNFSMPRPNYHDSWATSDKGRESTVKTADSPTLGPGTGLGLSGMIRTHLRQDSDRSSVVPPSPDRSQFPPPMKSRQASVASTSRTANPPASVHSDPWEYENTGNVSQSPKFPPQANEPVPTMSQKAQQILGHAMMQRNQASNKAQRLLGDEAPESSNEAAQGQSWQDELQPVHRRMESSDTQKESRAFDTVLAERRRKINEDLKTTADGEPRSWSPSVGGDRFNNPHQQYPAPRQRPNKKQLADNMNDPQPKAMKMLGITTRPYDDRGFRSPSPGMYRHDGREHMDQNPGWRPRQWPHQRPPPPVDPGHHHNGMRNPSYGRPQYPNGSQEDFERSRQRSATPNSGRGPRRDRAYSEASERSKSRQGRHRDDDYPPADYGRQASSNSPPQNVHREQYGGGSRDPRQYDRSPSAMSHRQRSGSRPPHPDQMDFRPHNGNPMMPPPPSNVHLAPRPSPRPPIANSPISPYYPGQSPGLSGPPSAVNSALPSPVVGNHPSGLHNNGATTTDANGRTTPNGGRKRSVTKTMISEPTFVSSTSSVPLVGLPTAGPRPNPIASPPVPAMNPSRRRGNTVSEKTQFFGNSPNPNSTATSPLPPGMGVESPIRSDSGMLGFDHQNGKPSPKPRNRLRKSSSEGGNMASRARQQAIMHEMGRQNDKSPNIPVFPNHSTTALGQATRQEGAMF